MKTVSLEIINNNGKPNAYCIIFEENKIEKLIPFPCDYRIDEICELIIQDLFASTIFILDKYGYGHAAYEILKDKGCRILDVDIIQSRLAFLKVKEALLELSLNSQFDTFSKFEFKRMVEEIESVELIEENGRVKLQKKDGKSNKPILRATCLLNWIATIQYIIKG